MQIFLQSNSLLSRPLFLKPIVFGFFLLFLASNALIAKTAEPKLALKDRIAQLEKEIDDIQYQNYMNKRVYGDQKKAAPSKPTREIYGFQNTSILEESLPPFGDPDDRPAPENNSTDSEDTTLNKEDPNDIDQRNQDTNKDGDTQDLPSMNDLRSNSAESAIPPQSPQEELYRQAVHYISQQRPDLAREHLDDLAANYTNTPEGILALYWIGEMMAETGNFAGASVAYGRSYGAFKSVKAKKGIDVGQFYGEEERLPEILFKLAHSLKRIGKTKEACVTLAQINKDFKNLPPTLEGFIKSLKKSAKCR